MAIDNIAIGARIKALRKERGMTQTKLGEKVGVGKSTLAKYEAGRIVRPPLRMHQMFASTLGVTLDYLLYGAPEPLPTPASSPALTATIRCAACGETVLATKFCGSCGAKLDTLRHRFAAAMKARHNDYCKGADYDYAPMRYISTAAWQIAQEKVLRERVSSCPDDCDSAFEFFRSNPSRLPDELVLSTPDAIQELAERYRYVMVAVLELGKAFHRPPRVKEPPRPETH